MPSTGRPLPLPNSRRAELLGITVVNSIPVVGVVALGWNAAALVLLYWLELGVDSLWALVRALFAGRPPELDTGGLLLGPLAARQPALSIPWTGLRIYLTTLMTLPVVAAILFMALLLGAAVAVGPLGTPPEDVLASVLLATAGIFCATGATTLWGYFYRGGYRSHSSQTAITGVFFRIATAFLTVMFAIAVIAAASAESPDAELGSLDPAAVGLPMLLVIVGLKFGSDLLGAYGDRLAVYFGSFDRTYGWAEPPSEPTDIERSLPDAPRRVRPTRWGRVLGGPLRLPQHPGALYLGAMGLAVAALFAIGQIWRTVALIAAASIAGPVALVSLDHLLRYGAVEYRIAPDRGALVAYDRLFGTALWRVEAWDERTLRVERTPVDALLDTETVTIELEDDEHVLPHLPDAGAALAAFDRRPERSRRLVPGDTRPPS